MADYKLWNALKDAKKYRWVELSHSLNNESPYWSGIPEGSVELAKTVWDWGKPELECLILPRPAQNRGRCSGACPCRRHSPPDTAGRRAPGPGIAARSAGRTGRLAPWRIGRFLPARL